MGSNSSWNQELWALLSKARAAGAQLHAAMGKEVKSELKQQCVSNSINVIIHYLITEMVSHCSGRLGETDRPEPGFCLTEQHQRWGFDEWQLNLVR